MGDLNGWLTDNPQRRGALISAIDPHVKTMRKAHPKMSWEEAATKLWENDEFANEMTQRVLGDMVDFGDLSRIERDYVKRAIPFYSWIKGATKIGARALREEPWKVAAGAQLANYANDQLRAEFGDDLAPFQLGMMHGPGGKMLMTQSLNPFQTPTDVFSMIAGMATPGGNGGSQNPLAQAGPVPKALLEPLANRDFFTGGTLDYSGEKSYLSLVKQQAWHSLAQQRLINAIRGKGNESPNRLYQRSPADATLQYLGAPVRTLR